MHLSFECFRSCTILALNTNSGLAHWHTVQTWNPHWKECKSFPQRDKLESLLELSHAKMQATAWSLLKWGQSSAILFFNLKILPIKCQLIMRMGRDLWKVNIICNILTVILKIFVVKISITTQTACLWVLIKTEQCAKQISFEQWKNHLKLCVIYTI